MEVYVLEAHVLVIGYEDRYTSKRKEVVAITDTLDKAEEIKEEFNNLSENNHLEGINRVIGIKELKLDKIYKIDP